MEAVTQAAAAVLTAGVDWLTCTAAADPGRSQLLAVSWPLLYQEAEAGNLIKPWLWKGYVGYAAGSVAVGEREDGVYCRLSGLAAFAGWQRCAPWWGHVSRLDLQVTARLPPDENPALAAYHASQGEGSVARGRRLALRTHIEDTRLGETTYLGSRTSDKFGRLYNKAVESGLEMYNGCWRWEVEYKGRASTSTADWLSEQRDTSMAAAVAVHETFLRWDAAPAWALGEGIPPDPPHRTVTDVERQLGWLATQVRPVVARLSALGYGERVRLALDIENLLD